MSSLLDLSEAQLTIFGDGASKSFSEEEGFLSVEDSWDNGNDTEDTGSVDLDTGCPISKVPLCFCSFLGFWSTYRGTSDLYSTALEICYIIATRILKIDSEIAEIIMHIFTQSIEKI